MQDLSLCQISEVSKSEELDLLVLFYFQRIGHFQIATAKHALIVWRGNAIESSSHET